MNQQSTLYSWKFLLLSFFLGITLSSLFNKVLFSSDCEDNVFSTFYHSLEASNEVTDYTVGNSLMYFQASVAKNPTGQKYLDKALQLNHYLGRFNDEINKYQREIFEDSLGIKMVGSDIQREVENLMVEYGAKFISVFEDEEFERERSTFKKSFVRGAQMFPPNYELNGDDFYGSMALLEKIKFDAKNSILSGILLLKDNVAKDEIIYDAFDVVILSNKTELKRGEEFLAEVFLAAASSSSKPSIKINKKYYPVDSGGRASFRTKTDKAGVNSVKAEITYKDGFGITHTLNSRLTYNVVP